MMHSKNNEYEIMVDIDFLYSFQTLTTWLLVVQRQ